MARLFVQSEPQKVRKNKLETRVYEVDRGFSIYILDGN